MSQQALVKNSYVLETTKEDVIKHFDGDFAPALIHKVVDEMPRFAGCEDILIKKEKEDCSTKNLLNFIYTNIKYPAISRDASIEGTVVIRFVVDKTGKVIQPEILRDIGGGCGEEALKVVKMMPEWIPGMQDGKAVNVYFNLPVKFKLQEDLPTESIEDEEIYKLVEEMPRFYNKECENADTDNKTKTECSQQEMLMFIYNNIKYPSLARAQGVEGTTVIRFVVEKDGSITGAEAVRNPGGGLGEEAVRVVNMMPKWIPGTQAGKIVKVYYNLPVKFKLEGSAIEEQKYYEIDGQESTLADVKKLTPDDIKTIDVKGGDEAIKRYGEKAKDGAMIITTKKVVINSEDVAAKALPGIYNKEINLEKAPTGTLLLQVVHKGSVYTEKFIRQ